MLIVFDLLGNAACVLRNALERANNGTELTQTDYEYSILGLPSARVEDGQRWTFVRDPDGRISKLTAPDGLTTTVRRTWDGLAAEITTRRPIIGGVPELVSRTRQSFSRDGHVLRFCRELVADGCSGFETFQVSDNGLLSLDPSYQLTVYEYDAADRLSKIVDPIGLVTESEYNSRGLPIHVREKQLRSKRR